MTDQEFKDKLKNDISIELDEIRSSIKAIDLSILNDLEESHLIIAISKIKQFKFFIKPFSQCQQ